MCKDKYLNNTYHNDSMTEQNMIEIKKIKEETNLILHDQFNAGIKEMQLVNTICDALESYVDGK